MHLNGQQLLRSRTNKYKHHCQFSKWGLGPNKDCPDYRESVWLPKQHAQFNLEEKQQHNKIGFIFKPSKV